MVKVNTSKLDSSRDVYTWRYLYPAKWVPAIWPT